jgi:hypothetical protein
MKNLKQLIIVAVLAIFGIIGVFIACDSDNNKTVLCTCPEGTTHEPDEKCCNGTDCNCPIAEPSNREFIIPITLDYSNTFYPESTATYDMVFRDDRTACGSATLIDIGIVDKIQQTIITVFDPNIGSLPIKNNFRSIFSQELGVTIIVENGDYYNSYKINDGVRVDGIVKFHIDYIKDTDVGSFIFTGRVSDGLCTDIYEAFITNAYGM